MSRIILVRHGKAAAGWDADHDPGLDAAGAAQAEAMAASLASVGPLPLFVSPLRRTRETVAPLERLWGRTATVEPGVGEIPSPVADLAARGQWLRGVMQGSWDDIDDDSRAWRDDVVATVRRIGAAGDAVIVSHFIAINAVVGAATGDRRVVCFAPDNCSQTVVEVDGEQLDVVELGGQARTVVN